MDRSAGRLTVHGRLYDTRHETRPLLRAKRRGGDNARNAAVTFLATLGVFYDMHGADHACRRRGLAPTGCLDRRLGGIARMFGSRGRVYGATDSIPPDMGRRSPGVSGLGVDSLGMTTRCAFLNGGHRHFRFMNGVSRFVWHLSN